MKPNFEAMSKAELKAYVLSHRDDDEAIRVFFGRRNPPDSQVALLRVSLLASSLTII